MKFMKDNKLKIGFIGCGKIARFHADVLKYLGHDIVAVAALDLNSNNLKYFRKEYKVMSSYSSWPNMLENEKLDALWVLVNWDIIDKIFLDILAYGIPTFFEKPIALNIEKIDLAVRNFPKMIDKVQIGYNRRFYSIIPQVQELLSNLDIKSIEVHIPESIEGIKDINLINNLFVMNSLHVIDLLFYLLEKKDIEVIKVYGHTELNEKTLYGYNGLLLAGEIPIHLISNWNSPTNFGLKFHSDGTLLSLMPIEMAQIFKGFDISEPTKEIPIRRYLPKVVEQIFLEGESTNFKPGFLEQARNFIDTCVLKTKTNTVGCNLLDVQKVYCLAQKITIGNLPANRNDVN